MRDAFGRLFPTPLAIRRLPREAADSVLLTFDDGPAAESTPRLLDVLAEHGARAAFFLVGRMASRDPETVRRIARAGHAVGSHSRTHSERPGSWRALLRDARDGRDDLLRILTPATRLYRPPFGRLSPPAAAAVHVAGLRSVLWSVDSGDWRCRDETDARALGRDLVPRLRGRDILLLHDYTPLIIPLVEILLPGLAARGLDLARGADFLEPRRFAAEDIGDAVVSHTEA